MSATTTIKCPNCKSNVPIGYPICPYCGYDLRPIIRLKARQELTKRDIILRIRDSLIKPWKVYDSVILAPDSLGPLLIIMIISLLTALRLLIVLNKVLGFTELSTIADISLLLTLAFAGGFILYLCIWLGFSIYTNFILRLLGANTDFSLTRSLVGYSSSVLILFSAVSTLITVFMPNNPTLTTEPSIIGLSRIIIFIGIILVIGMISIGAAKAYFLNKYLVFVLLFPLALIAYLSI